MKASLFPGQKAQFTEMSKEFYDNFYREKGIISNEELKNQLLKIINSIEI